MWKQAILAASVFAGATAHAETVEQTVDGAIKTVDKINLSICKRTADQAAHMYSVRVHQSEQTTLRSIDALSASETAKNSAKEMFETVYEFPKVEGVEKQYKVIQKIEHKIMQDCLEEANIADKVENGEFVK